MFRIWKSFEKDIIIILIYMAEYWNNIGLNVAKIIILHDDCDQKVKKKKN